MAAKKGTTTKKTSTTSTKTAAKTEETQQAATTEEAKTDETQAATEETQKEPTEGATNDPAEEPTQDPEPATEETATEEQAEEEPSFDVPEKLYGLASRLNDYVESMAPNVPLNSDEIQTQQLKLRAVINTLLKTDDELFGDAMKHVVSVVRKNRDGVFSERLIFRGFPQLKLARSERQRLETLVSLLLATADAQNPSKVTDVVDMNVVFRYVTDNDQQQRLQSFYGM